MGEDGVPAVPDPVHTGEVDDPGRLARQGRPAPPVEKLRGEGRRAVDRRLREGIRDRPCRHDSGSPVLRRQCIASEHRVRAVGEAGDMDARAAGHHADAAGLGRPLQLADRECRLGEVTDVDLGAIAGEDDADAEPLVDRERDRRPVAGAVVELPGRDVVEDGGVLDGIGIADLMRAHEERLVVLLVPPTPDDAVEAPLATERQLGLDDTVGELDAVDRAEHGRVDRVDEEAFATEVLRRRLRARGPLPEPALERDGRQRRYGVAGGRHWLGVPTTRHRPC